MYVTVSMLARSRTAILLLLVLIGSGLLISPAPEPVPGLTDSTDSGDDDSAELDLIDYLGVRAEAARIRAEAARAKEEAEAFRRGIAGIQMPSVEPPYFRGDPLRDRFIEVNGRGTLQGLQTYEDKGWQVERHVSHPKVHFGAAVNYWQLRRWGSGYHIVSCTDEETPKYFYLSYLTKLPSAWTTTTDPEQTLVFLTESAGENSVWTLEILDSDPKASSTCHVEPMGRVELTCRAKVGIGDFIGMYLCAGESVRHQMGGDRHQFTSSSARASLTDEPSDNTELQIRYGYHWENKMEKRCWIFPDSSD